MIESQLTNRRKWIVASKHGLLSGILFFIVGLIFEVQTKVIRIKVSFWDLWQFYGITNLILLSFLFGAIMASQKRLFFTSSGKYVWLWPLLLILVTLFPFVFYVGRDDVVPLYFGFWIIFAGICLVLIASTKCSMCFITEGIRRPFQDDCCLAGSP